jgi:hypothetical protein
MMCSSCCLAPCFLTKFGRQVRGEQGFEEIPQDSTFIRLVWYDPTLDSTSVGDGVSPPGKGAFRDPIAVFYSPNGTIGEFRAKVKILRFFFSCKTPMLSDSSCVTINDQVASMMGVEVARCRLMKVSTYSTVSTIFYDQDDVVCFRVLCMYMGCVYFIIVCFR